MCRTPEYRAWTALIQRCTNPKTPYWHRYGGRGIKVCKRWLESFDNFYTDMGPKPSSLHEIDRKDNDGHYTPKNCRWVTPKVNSLNKEDSVRLDPDAILRMYVDEQRTTREIADRFDCGYNSVNRALRELGIQLRGTGHRSVRTITFRGETDRISVFAKRYGHHPMAIKWRLDHGWLVKDALLTPSSK